MVTSDEERQGEDAQELAPLAAPLTAPETEHGVEAASGDGQGAEDAGLQGGVGAVEAMAMQGEGGVIESAPSELDPIDPPSLNELAANNALPAPIEESASEMAAVGEAAPTIPAMLDPASDASLSEDEATGRRVESLLAEAPDGHPEGPLPARGEPAPLSFDQPEPFPLSSASSAFRDAVLNRNGMDRMGPIVAFDFDGTLTVRDSFTAFLKWREGSARYHGEMAALAPAALKYLFDRDPGKLKAAAVRRFLQGLPRSVLNEEAMEFATVSAPMLFRPDALKAWRRYRQDGARLMIVTASPENIVAPFARGLGADMLIATQLLFDEEDRVQGGLLGDNCRGPEKVRRIKRALGEDVGLAAAYGDTDGDWEMLDMAEQQFMRLFVGVPGKPAGPG